MHFCSTCAFAGACRAEGYDKAALMELHCLVEHIGPFQAGDYIFREGESFNAIAAVRAGTVKTFTVDAQGREQVLGFFLPGEVIGLNAIHSARFPCNVMALDTVMLCRFSFPMMATLATRMPGLQGQLFRLLSQDINKAALLAGDFSADERMAAFLLSFSRRFAARGWPRRRSRAWCGASRTKASSTSTAASSSCWTSIACTPSRSPCCATEGTTQPVLRD